MPYTDLTEDQITRDLGYARARLQAAGEWLERAEQARLETQRAAQEADRAIDLDDVSPESAVAGVAAKAASAAAHGALVVHRMASEECAAWQREVFELDEALDIKRGGVGTQA